MALSVEDGSGVASADTYASRDTVVAYAAARGLSFPVTDTDAADAAIRRGTTWLDNTYRTRFVGYRTHRRAQGLEWPRTAAYYYNPKDSGARGQLGGYGYGLGYGLYEYDQIDPATVPIEIINATCEAAVRELASPGSLAPDVTGGKIKKSVRVEGAVSVEYAVGLGDARSQTPAVQIIDGIIATLLSTSGRSPYSGSSVRA